MEAEVVLNEVIDQNKVTAVSTISLSITLNQKSYGLAPKKLLNESKSTGNMNAQIVNLKNMISETARHVKKLSKKSPARLNDPIDPQASEITEKLYEDAMTRISNIRKQEREQSKTPKKSKATLTSKASIKVLESRFISDFDLLIKKKKFKSRLNYRKTELIVKELGFMSTDKKMPNDTEEKVLFVDLWG